MSNLLKGTGFEIEVAERLNVSNEIISMTDIKLYSHGLRKETQIDNVIITPSAVIVVESKSFSSALHGNMEDDWWVGVTGRKSTKIFNPVIQNYEHVRALQNRMFSLVGKFFPLAHFVVVPDGTAIHTNSEKVLPLYELAHRIRETRNKRAIIDVKVMEEVMYLIRR